MWAWAMRPVAWLWQVRRGAYASALALLPWEGGSMHLWLSAPCPHNFTVALQMGMAPCAGGAFHLML